MSHIPDPDQTPEGPAFEGRVLPRPEDEVVDQGARFDIATLVTRRRVLGVVGVGAGALALAACGSDSSGSSGSSTASGSTGSGSTGSGSTTSSTTSDGEIPEETNGPYPADGTNGVNVLEESGIVRSDITSSLDGGTTVDGVPLTFTFTLTDMVNDAPFEGAAVYVWHCDAQGLYSMYSEGVEDETYLRGIQVADAKGQVTFQTIMPACYSGRWPHIHFEVYPDADSATTADNAIATSQVALPEDVLADIYALDTYAGSAENLSQVSLDTDNVFSDGYDLELGTFSGDVDSGFVGSLAVGVDTSTEAGGGGTAPAAGGGGTGGTPPDGGTPPSGAPSAN
ncbi:intradiol ring-cleavage dioxygenase [Nocardioides mangrovi]|uniref:Intradiol ring-cleavage dioxygenase n=1 Tax=Nocardioides mangrovi TaxID=2874580 RepID=A0ABS7UD42_9ACTN|nr:intradiol ring-cleavage dioxygenase [Nocardioides mangrovi]MBZ5738621.1 intradiol ring-cleavage dioxygenase [Nocardioides mangrovi]